MMEFLGDFLDERNKNLEEAEVQAQLRYKNLDVEAIIFKGLEIDLDEIEEEAARRLLKANSAIEEFYLTEEQEAMSKDYKIARANEFRDDTTVYRLGLNECSNENGTVYDDDLKTYFVNHVDSISSFVKKIEFLESFE